MPKHDPRGELRVPTPGEWVLIDPARGCIVGQTSGSLSVCDPARVFKSRRQAERAARAVRLRRLQPAQVGRDVLVEPV